MGLVLEMQSRWSDLWEDSPPFAVLELYLKLARNYTAPERAYHNLEHIRFGLDLLEHELTWHHVPEEYQLVVKAAWWIHDYIYDPRRSDNEELCATAARVEYPLLSMARKSIDHVSDLVMTTKHGEFTPLDLLEKLIIDVDLAILGTPPPMYDQYAAGIRKEYEHVPEDAYRKGRSAVLSGFLARETLFHTERLRVRFEESARENLKREIASLVA